MGESLTASGKSTVQAMEARLGECPGQGSARASVSGAPGRGGWGALRL